MRKPLLVGRWPRLTLQGLLYFVRERGRDFVFNDHHRFAGRAVALHIAIRRFSGARALDFPLDLWEVDHEGGPTTGLAFDRDVAPYL
jgi:hypothetical protein